MMDPQSNETDSPSITVADMPNLARKLVILAAADGLILLPRHNGRHNGSIDAWPLCISYESNKIVPLTSNPPDLDEDKLATLEAYGLVGLLSVSSYSYLVPIIQRRLVAQIQGKPVYAVTNVALIPISSQDEAIRAISHARKGLGKEGADLEETGLEDTSEEESDTDDAGVPSLPVSPGLDDAAHSTAGSISSSIAEDVIGKKLPFSRGAAGWLSTSLTLPGLASANTELRSIPAVQDSSTTGKLHDQAEEKNLASDTTVEDDDADAEPGLSEIIPAPSDRTVTLLPKLLRYTKLLFASENFFFSHGYDLTRRVGVNDLAKSALPLHKVVDPLYFWNKHLMMPLIEAGAHGYVLPLIQGFVGRREFTVAASKIPPTSPETVEAPAKGRMLGAKNEAQDDDSDAARRDFLLTLISRRSVKRAGLRYLRRGVDDEGNTANFVETEQILSVPDWDPSHKVYSYLQVRGSIPLYFSQSPYSLKPVPVSHHTSETNQLAFSRHFRELKCRYGKVQAVSLLDKHGVELKIGEQYEKYSERLNESGGIDGDPLNFVWFDFHNECRGMKFENVKNLVDSLQETLEDFGDNVLQGDHVMRNQAGIFRTNCMDCLDRTGVAQCAFASWALAQELKSEGFEIDLTADSSTQWFNTIWADNGDAISKQYSSTAALKGDYTRTRKRNYRGALNDFGLTLSRFYNNIVNDFFGQACIDYLLGNVSTQVFTEFEMEMQTADPGISVEKLRQNAIEASYKIVISDPSEEFLGGWTMLTPRQPNTLRTLPFEESVLLLTDAAVYSCRFDWSTDKVLSFERIDLRSISRINYGTYITSILTETQTDEKTNVGLVIMYRDRDENAVRVNTRSLQSNVNTKALDDAKPSTEWDIYSWFKGSKRPASRFLAFKALPLSTSVALKTPTPTRTSLGPISTVSETDFVRSVCEQIESAMMAGDEPRPETQPLIDESQIISLADAKKRTGYLEYLVYDIKKMVWA